MEGDSNLSDRLDWPRSHFKWQVCTFLFLLELRSVVSACPRAVGLADTSPHMMITGKRSDCNEALLGGLYVPSKPPVVPDSGCMASVSSSSRLSVFTLLCYHRFLQESSSW